ncbi:4'-phosphopantetheinyl transferase [Paenibacillus helianthi]|uniref:Holo-[acyl-carrier-protein] synthase n=1 Tax=Paenibacillus helianthi TaxID=1349432 RepID=A0ABX3EQ89_9BACL|nr:MULTISPECIES: holo-ACP synthase [Paenibacillus]OKP73847.1 4'-phosphopantetheinyl transferase [Paenibacillus sp. P3E]OKP87958.1 4'-phosphopantetheinyl transferase [Paenibacillus helianthi]
MIYGIGHDVLEIGRIVSIADGNLGHRFIRRILTGQELVLAKRRGGKAAEFIAGRFSAKEAVVKALGCGIGHTVGFQDIEILPDDQGKPVVSLSAEAWARLLLPEQEYAIHLTITHSRDLASTFVVVERLPAQ